jgi:hypothetical protein
MILIFLYIPEQSGNCNGHHVWWFCYGDERDSRRVHRENIQKNKEQKNVELILIPQMQQLNK